MTRVLQDYEQYRKENPTTPIRAVSLTDLEPTLKLELTIDVLL